MNVQRYARVAGVLFLLSMVAGGFGEAYVPSKLIVSGDAAATVANIKNFDFLYRLGFAAFMVESLCDITLALILYALLKPISKELSLLAAFFGLIGTALFAFAELFYLAPTRILGSTGYLQRLLARSTQCSGTAVAKVLCVWWHDIHGLLRHRLDCPVVFDLSLGLSAKISGRAHGNRRHRVCRKEFPADPRARLRLGRVSDVDVPWRTDTGCLVAD